MLMQLGFDDRGDRMLIGADHRSDEKMPEIWRIMKKRNTNVAHCKNIYVSLF